jgi:hypothetical protein
LVVVTAADVPPSASDALASQPAVTGAGGPSPTYPRALAVIVGGLLLAAAAILPLFRQTGARSWNTIWAEDGFVYFQQARRQGGLAVLLHGYNGYLQLPPRILAVFAAFVPIHDLSVYLALAATIVGALLAWFTYQTTEQWIASRPVRLALASMVALMPALGVELTANITNVIWVFVAVAPWALVSLAERPWDVAIRGLVALLAAASSTLCFLFLPLALGWLLIRKTRAALEVAAAFCAGLVIQGLVSLYTPSNGTAALPSSFHTLDRTVGAITNDTGLDVFSTYIFGTHGLTEHHVLAITGTLLTVAILAVLLIGAGRTHQLLAVVFAVYAVVMFVAPAWNRQSVSYRYSVIPVMLLASAVAVLVGDPTRTRGRGIARIGRWLFVVQIVVVTVIGFSGSDYRSESPKWPSSVTYTSHVTCHRAPPNKLVEVRTDVYNFWPVTLPCHDLSP